LLQGNIQNWKMIELNVKSQLQKVTDQGFEVTCDM